LGCSFGASTSASSSATSGSRSILSMWRPYAGQTRLRLKADDRSSAMSRRRLKESDDKQTGILLAGFLLS
jgi:hypothetical protein